MLQKQVGFSRDALDREARGTAMTQNRLGPRAPFPRRDALNTVMTHNQESLEEK